MALAKTYNPIDTEDKWYQHWLTQDFFSAHPNPEKEPYTIVIPPPNVTGVLHMGHMLNNTIQDVLIRKARMEGKEACWVPGTDHASIATEAKVVKMLKDQGIDKQDITREEFLKHAWAWKEKYGGIILEQLKKLGASCDWNRTRFTMEEDLSKQVLKVFVDLYNKGYIYRGVRMVNWDPEGRTALADDEVIYKENKGKLFYVKYRLENTENQFITIATTRPETILGDTAVCVHPEDERYQDLIGKKAIIPLVNRTVPIIADDYIDPEFGTGCLKVTPAHDLNDYEIGLRHNLEVVDTINDDGTMSEAAGFYVGEDRFVVRKKIINDLKELGQLISVEEITNKVGHSERTDAVIEPKLSTQWFVRMKDLTPKALEKVEDNTIKLHPPKFKNMYRSWMENVRDWCISRQLWWGHRIPAYFLPNGEFVVAETAKEALKLAQEKDPQLTAQDLRQEEDVLDTWFSSGLWPISVFNGLLDPENEEIKYFYPTNVLVTAPEILFFWVARMIISGYEYRDQQPFSDVYLTGIVRDKLRRKMSKSLGNSPDPLELIKQYGADGIRTGMLFSSPAGNDLLFDEKLCEQGRNFCNKIWNAFRLIKGWEIVDKEAENSNLVAIEWMENKLNEALTQLEDHYQKYRMSDALMTVYKLIWDNFCSWYLEMIKPPYGQPIDHETYDKTIVILEKLMKILHPFMPFITEEIWHQITERTEKDCIIVADYPKPVPFDETILKDANQIFEVVTALRNTRNSKGISPKQELILYIKTDENSIYEKFKMTIKKLANISAISYTPKAVEKTVSFLVKVDEFFIPIEGQIDTEAERQKIEKELQYTKGFLKGVEKKLSNERFVNNAPAKVVENERQKQADALAKIETLEKSLKALG